MLNQDHTSLDRETRDAFVGAFIGDSAIEPVSDEDLAVVAARGLDSFSPKHRDRLLKAMIANTDGAAGTVDVFRYIRSELDQAGDIENEILQKPMQSKRFDFVSSSMAGVWAVAACLALLFSVGSLNTPIAQSPSGNSWPLETETGPLNQEGISGISIEDLLNEQNTQPIDKSLEEGVDLNKSKSLWLTVSVLIVILIPPAFWLYRRKQQ